MPDPQLLTKGKIEGQAIGNGASYDLLGPDGSARILCEGDSTLVVQVDMTAGAAPDLAVVVSPYEADGVTISPVVLPTVLTVGPTLNGGHAYFYAQYDVTALDVVRVRVTNNNAVPQTITRAGWKLA